MASEKKQDVCWRCKLAKDASWNYCPHCSARLIDQRNPSPPNLVRDVSFLYDIYSFGWYNHHVNAVALYDSAAQIKHFYQSSLSNQVIPVHHSFIAEPRISQKILRAKIFAELISLLEAFGVLAIAITKRRKQSFMWTYLHTEPQDVTQWYNNILNNPSRPLDQLLKLPRITAIRKALEKGVQTTFPSIPDALPLLDIEVFIKDYMHLMNDIVLIAKMYSINDGINVRIYNKVKHIFSLVEGDFWLTRPSGPMQAAIALDDQGLFSPLPMEETEIDNEILTTYKVTGIGAEVMALCITLARVNLLL